ncbi:fimbrial protein [Achromobacter seleniivolatilans]|uniref:Fimbrial protein n=1 Tax=Achromobacter seleniivolatilans TaxID=3047478 RepID=A0ABY9LUP5_9BURK|nr:fimbrial protein [Achromobacter sp. R39]WMD18509.1 fimbrial protein [Achromobacter sp. R39]
MRRYEIFGTFKNLLCVLALLFLPHLAHASCSASPAMPYLQTMNNMAVASNLAVGETIPGSMRHYTLSGQCTASGANYSGAPVVSCYYGSGTEVMPGIYSTGVGGVGIRLRNAAGQPMTNASGVNCDTRAARLGTLNADLTYSITISIEFVKTGAILGGNLDQSQTWFGFGVYNGGAASTLGGGGINYMGFSGNIVTRQIACNVTYPPTVSLAAVAAKSISGVGSTALPTPFSIGLTCDGAAVVGITFDGAVGTPINAAAAGVFGILNEGAPGVASGVGVQLVNAVTHAPVPLQTRTALGSIAANLQSTYQYAIRYYGLTATPSPGVVNGAMVFTFDYQ